MSTALATQVPTAGTSVDELFDFAASHARATNRLKKALDGNGASATDFQSLSLTQHMQGIWILATAKVTWTARWETFAGKARGNIQYAEPGDLEAVARRGFAAFAAKPAHVETLVALFTASPAKGFAAGPKIELGGVPVSYAAEQYCNACNGRGRIGCTACNWGKQTCNACWGKGTIWTGSSHMRCNCSGGQMNCTTCGGCQIIGCAPCGRNGIFTTLWTGSIHADVDYKIHTPDGSREDWTKALTESGHDWLADAGFVAPPYVDRYAGGVGLGWDVKVPVLGQEFRIKDRQYHAQYVGRRERMWKMPRFLDDLLQPLSGSIERAQGAEAFSLARTAPVLDAIRSVVLHQERSDEAVAAEFENAVTADFVAGVRTHLEVARDRIAGSSIRSVWKYATVFLTVACLAALASGQFRGLLAAFDPAHQRTDPGGGALVGGALLAALLGVTYLLAGLAGRSAVRTVLETKADRLPSQGWTPAIAACASLAVYVTCASLIGSGTSSPAPATGPALAVSSLPHVPPPTIPWVPSR
jgi:hypothetical protein